MKRIKIVLAAMLLTATVIGSFAFTSKDYHKAFAVTCYSFKITVTPGTGTVILSSNYNTANPTINCNTPRQRYCAICFDPALFPGYVNADGTLNFSNEDLTDAVLGAWSSNSEGTVVNGITFHFRVNP